MNEKITKAELIYDQWSKGYGYFRASAQNLDKKIPKYVDMYEGRQWPPKTNNTKDLPRPVTNIIDMIIDSRTSNILGNPIKLNYIADNNTDAATMFSRFDSYISKEMQESEYDEQNVKDALIKGTGIAYFYWDEFAVGKRGNYEGGLRMKLLEPLDVVVADPTEKDCQKQRWIIIRSRQEVENVKKLVKGKLKELIEANNAESEYEDYTEIDTNDLVTVYTKFFRKDGEVYYTQSTKDILLLDDTPLNPLLNKKYVDSEEEDAGIEASQDTEVERAIETKYKANLYPLDFNVLNPKNASIYGRSEVDDLIEVQKSINFLIAMAILNCQQLGSPKYVAKKGALNGQQITNKIGEVLIDNTPLGNNGIYTLKAEPFTAGALTLAPTIFEFVRTVSNANEVITGDIATKDLSGTAIAQLQAQSLKPTAAQQKRFWRHKERCGKVKEMFYKLFYEDKEFSYSLSQDEILALREANKGITNVIPESESKYFNGNEFRDIAFSIVVEAGAGTQYSEIQSLNILNNLLQMKEIDFRTYVEMYPDTAMPFKEELKRFLDKKEQSELNVVKQQYVEMQEELAQVTAYSKQQEQAIKELMQQFEKNAQYSKAMKDEYSSKIIALQNAIREDMAKRDVIAPQEEA